jgi:hypothetical protein
LDPKPDILDMDPSGLANQGALSSELAIKLKMLQKDYVYCEEQKRWQSK